jgi:nicotinamidase-related amidase
MQNELLKGEPDASEDEDLQLLITNNRELMSAMRSRGWPVILAGGARRRDLLDDARSRVAPVMHARPVEVPYREIGSWGAQFLDGLEQKASDIVVDKKGNSAFGFTPLHRILRNAGVRHCLVTGGAVSGCVSDTIREGIGLGYEMTMISDAAYPLNAPYTKEIAELGQVRTTE